MPDYLILLIATVLYAAARGGAPERIAAAIIAVGSVLSVFAQTTGPHSFGGVEWRIFAIDLIDQFLLIVLALKANRFWIIPVAGMHLMPILAHLTKLLVPAIEPGVYARAEVIVARVVLILILVGTFRHRRRLKRLGTDPSWRISSQRQEFPTPRP